MKHITIDQNSQVINRIRFPDGQPHIRLMITDLDRSVMVDVVWRIRNPNELFELMQLVDVIRRRGGRLNRLTIPYLMGGRSDRETEYGRSVEVEIVGSIIKSFEFSEVILFDPHSDASMIQTGATSLIDNAALVKYYNIPDSVLIIPDYGASRKSGVYRDWNSNISTSVQCNKVRDPSTGKVTLQIPNPETLNDRNCVIIDDICDGGATFIAIAQQLKKVNRLTLMVSHGIFSKGFELLNKYFDHIVTTDSYDNYNNIHNELHEKPRNLTVLSFSNNIRKGV